MIVGDFNVQDSETCLSNFLFEISAKNIISNYTCYKSVENFTSIAIYKDKNNSKFKNKLVKAFRNMHLQYYISSAICIFQKAFTNLFLNLLLFISLIYRVCNGKIIY